VEPIAEAKDRWYREFSTESDAKSSSAEATRTAEAMQAGAVKILDRQPGRILVEADAPQRSILILSEIAYPGWRVSVDGRKSGWERVDYMLLGVPLAEGKHVVSLVYRPSSIKIGAVVSVTTALCLIVGALWGERKRSD